MTYTVSTTASSILNIGPLPVHVTPPVNGPVDGPAEVAVVPVGKSYISSLESLYSGGEGIDILLCRSIAVYSRSLGRWCGGVDVTEDGSRINLSYT